MHQNRRFGTLQATPYLKSSAAAETLRLHVAHWWCGQNQKLPAGMQVRPRQARWKAMGQVSQTISSPPSQHSLQMSCAEYHT
jgi:hypothetical protein